MIDCWLVDRLIDQLINCSIDWLIDFVNVSQKSISCQNNSLISYLIPSLILCLILCLIPSLILCLIPRLPFQEWGNLIPRLPFQEWGNLIPRLPFQEWGNLIPRLSQLKFLLACSMRNQRGKPWMISLYEIREGSPGWSHYIWWYQVDSRYTWGRGNFWSL